jgi:hypothetical protein
VAAFPLEDLTHEETDLGRLASSAVKQAVTLVAAKLARQLAEKLNAGFHQRHLE